MQRIRSKDTSIEVLLRKALWAQGIRYRKNYTKLPGKPDIAITKYKIAIFCDSEFFHGKDWDKLKERLSRSEKGEYFRYIIRSDSIDHFDRKQPLKLDFETGESELLSSKIYQMTKLYRI